MMMVRGVNGGESRSGSNALDTINAAASAIAAAESRVPQATVQVIFLKDLVFLVIIDLKHANLGSSNLGVVVILGFSPFFFLFVFFRILNSVP